MFKYIAQRLVLSIPVFLGVATIVFLVVRVIPGDPAVASLGDYASKEAVEALRQRMGLNESLPVQYARFLGGLARGDLGTSMITGTSIRADILHALPYTLELTVLAIIIGSILLSRSWAFLIASLAFIFQGAMLELSHALLRHTEHVAELFERGGFFL